MFNFTTQTIFNQIKVATTSEIEAGTAKDYNVITGEENQVPFVRFGNLRFDANNVESISKATHTDEHLAKVEFDMSKITEQNDKKDVPGSYRIAIYIRLSMNSQDSFYANDFVYKGKPLYIEFPVKANDTAEAIAKRVVKTAKNYMLLMMGPERLLNITANGTKVTIEGVNGYQQLTKAELQKFDPDALMVSCCGHVGEYAILVQGVPVAYKVNNGTVTSLGVLEEGEIRDLDTDTEVGIEPGLEAFLDYNWIMHNLRLPTLANTNIWAPTKNEQPVVGGKYNQYILRLCKERDGIAGEVVGQRATSVTTHVLYVLDSGNAVTDIEQVLNNLAAAKNPKLTMSTKADEVFNEPYKAVTATSSGDSGNNQNSGDTNPVGDNNNP